MAFHAQWVQDPNDENDPDDYELKVRASRRERRSGGEASQAVAVRLGALEASLLANIEMTPRVREFLDDVRAMKPSSARRRSERRLAQMIRDDSLTESLADAVNTVDDGKEASARVFKHAEAWRDGLADGKISLASLHEALGREVPTSIAKAVDDAQHERNWGKPKGAARALFRALTTLFGSQPPPAPPLT